MPITTDRIVTAQQELFPLGAFPAEQPRESTGLAVTDSIAHLQFIALATIFIQHREPEFLTEVVAVWFLKLKLNQTLDKAVSLASTYTDEAAAILQGALTAEQTSRIAGDATLLTDLNNESAARASGDTNLSNSLAQEVSDRTIGDATLRTDLSSETSARTAGDTALQTSLTAETTARTNADSTLQTALTTETQARLGADASLLSDLNSEIANRTSADASLRADLTTESATRLGADNTLTANLAAETAARQQGDSTLQGELAAEAAARGSADTGLQTAITTEIANRSAADSAMDIRLSNAIASEVTARTTADIQINDAIAAIRRGFVPPIQLVQTLPYTLGSALPSSLNGITPVAGMRMLLTAQTDPTQNRVIVIDDPTTGAYHFPPDNVVQGTEYIFTGGGTYQGYSWVLSNPIDRDPVEGTDALTWSPIIRPDALRGDDTYTRLTGNQIGFIPESAPRLVQEQIGLLPPLVYVLGDGATGGTIVTDSGTGNSYVVVNYAPLVRNMGLVLPIGTRTYYAMNLGYVAGGAYIGNATVTPISNDQVRVDFVGNQAPNLLQLVLGGIIPTMAAVAAMTPPPTPTPTATPVPTPVPRTIVMSPSTVSISGATPYTITLSGFDPNTSFSAQWFRDGVPAHPNPANLNSDQYPVSGTADVYANMSFFPNGGPGEWQLRAILADNTMINSNLVTVGN